MEEIFKQYLLEEEVLQKEVVLAMGDLSEADIEIAYEKELEEFRPGNIVEGEIVGIFDDEVAVNIGYKSEGFVPGMEFEDPVDLEIGNRVHVFIVMMEGPNGMVVLSKKKADLAFGWKHILEKHDVGDVTVGKAIRKIKGGLLVDIGVPVFMPASQIDIRRRPDIASYIGEELECKIIKIDEEQKNIVVSRRRLIEEKREKAKESLLETLEKGQARKGVVKNITDFGAFIDLGGIDGLLHITDMSWSRVSHPSEIVALDEEVEVMILDFDKEKERISLGLKQKTPNPWKGIKDKYPTSQTVPGEVVNILPYGAFVKLEDGVEGLVHISEMSWTKRVKHPSEIVDIGDRVNVMILNIDEDKQEISLGMKQTEKNPWEVVKEKYPPGTVLRGKVRNLTSYGAFIEVEEGVDGLLHVSDMSWTKKVTHPKEMLKKGDMVDVKVLTVDQDKKRVSLGMKQLEENPWDTDIPNKYKQGLVVEGEISKLTSFGAFVELEEDLEGLLHISELSERKVMEIEDALQIGDKVNVMILELDKEEKKLRLSLRDVDNPVIEERLSNLSYSDEDVDAATRAKAEEAAAAEAAAEAGEAAPAEEAEAKADDAAAEEAPAEEADESKEVEAKADAEAEDAGEAGEPAAEEADEAKEVEAKADDSQEVEEDASASDEIPEQSEGAPAEEAEATEDAPAEEAEAKEEEKKEEEKE